MTYGELNQITKQYILLCEKENLSEKEELECNFYDKLLVYVGLFRQAKEMGNKDPESNFLVANAKKRLAEAQQRLKDFIGG